MSARKTLTKIKHFTNVAGTVTLEEANYESDRPYILTVTIKNKDSVECEAFETRRLANLAYGEGVVKVVKASLLTRNN